MRLRRAAPCCALLAWLLSTPAWPAPLLVELSGEASRAAINDLVRATVAAESSGATPGEPARQVNAQIAEALKTAKAYPAVKAQSGSTASYPVYAKGGKIEAWRVRSELTLESSDTAALSELLGKLQTSLGVSSLVLQPSAETRRQAEEQAMVEAIAAFKARASVVAETLGKTYRLKQLNIATGNRFVQPVFRSAARPLTADAAPMPVEAGESQVTASVSGQIELE